MVALALRLRDPLSSEILAAEDPYLFMERTWDFAQHRHVADYPPGFMLFLAPLTWAGPGAFFVAARFLPALLGVAAVVGAFVLAQRFLSLPAAFASAAFVAVMPEHIVRTNILFPTALDLALLPFLWLAVLRLDEGDRRMGPVLGVGLVAMLVVHPWFVALAFAPLAAFALVRLRARGLALGRLGLGLAVAGALFLVLASAYRWMPSPAWGGRAWTRFVELMGDPSSLTPLPPYVDLVQMLTIPALLLAVVGVAFSLRNRRPVDVLVLAWCAALLPLALVDWFDVWYIPHRVVGYLAPGVALLAGIGLDGVLRLLPRPAAAHPARVAAEPGVSAERRRRYASARAAAAACLLVLVAAPSGLVANPWYRIYDKDDYAAWDALDANETPLVVTGSWQSRAGYRALTGREAVFDWDFFWNESQRQRRLAEEPDLVVLVDEHARKEQNTEFVAGWTLIGRWGDVEAYRG